VAAVEVKACKNAVQRRIASGWRQVPDALSRRVVIPPPGGVRVCYSAQLMQDHREYLRQFPDAEITDEEDTEA